nr:putative reverse transcriptase domain-containing protein [Tanacetum cinerariifolium]
MILTAQKEVCDESAGLQKGLDEMIKHRSDRALYYMDRIWVPLKGDVRTLIMDEEHKSKYYVHPGTDKMYYDLRYRYWWPRMKKDIAVYVSRCLTCLKVKTEHQRPSGLLQLPEIPEWIWEGIAMDFVTSYQGLVTNDQSERTIQTLEYMLRACVLDFGGSWDVHLPLVEFSYNNSYHSSVRLVPFEALYGRKCRSLIMWAEIGEGQLIRPELVQENTKKISQIKDRLKDAHDRQKIYADKRRKLLEFSVDAKLKFKEEPVEILEREFKKLKWSRITIVKVRWNLKHGPEFTWEREDQMKLKCGTLWEEWKLAPRFVGPFEIVEKVGPMAYRLDFPKELNGVHNTFHVSNLKKCLADRTLEFKKLKRSRTAIVKVRLNSERGPEFTWEREDQMKRKFYTVLTVMIFMRIMIWTPVWAIGFVRDLGFSCDLRHHSRFFEVNGCDNFLHDIPNKIACKKFFNKNEEEIFTVAGDCARINPDGVTPPTM